MVTKPINCKSLAAVLFVAYFQNRNFGKPFLTFQPWNPTNLNWFLKMDYQRRISCRMRNYWRWIMIASRMPTRFWASQSSNWSKSSRSSYQRLPPNCPPPFISLLKAPSFLVIKNDHRPSSILLQETCRGFLVEWKEKAIFVQNRPKQI